MITSQTKKRTRKKATPAPIEEVFTSNGIKGLVLLLIIAFNVVILKNSFALVIQRESFSGNPELDGFLYGFAISVLMVIILFHEKNWQNALCPGAITLYINAMILILYTRWMDIFLGKYASCL